MKTNAMKNTETPRNILHHAIRLFAVNGFTETSLEDICGSALVSKPSIFYYFESKEGLYKAAWRKACHDVATSDIWILHGNPEIVLRETLCKLTGHYFSGGELAESLHFMFMECVHPRLIEKERDLKELSMIRSRISGLFNAFCPDLSDADIKLLLCAILGELITARSCLDKGAGPGANQRVHDKVEHLFRITSSVRRGLARERQGRISYEFIASQFKRLAPEAVAGRVIAAHLGSGASMCAMKNGRSFDTTMSFSALDGLPMGTRCGSLDPDMVLFLLQSRSREEIEDLLYKKSGLLGISGISNDVRELLASDKPLAAEAIEFFVYRAVREIGALTAGLGGLDTLIFTAGIGENSPVIRQRICEGLGWLGIRIDLDANQRGFRCISNANASPSVWVIPTDEERVIAEHTLAVIQARSSANKD